MPDVNKRVASVSASASIAVPTIEIKSLSLLLLDVAMCFTSESIKIRQSYNENAPNDDKNIQRSNYRAYVIGALFASVAFLDAAINEVFLDAVECLPKKYRKNAVMKNRKRKKSVGNLKILDSEVSPYREDKLSPSVVKNMAQLWLQQQEYNWWIKQNAKFKTYLSKKSKSDNVSYWLPAWDKYQLALFLNNKKPISKRNPRRRNVQTLINVRNELIHFKPGVSVSTPQSSTLEPVDYNIKVLKRQVAALINSDTSRPHNGYQYEKELLASGFPYDFLDAAFAHLTLQSILQFDEYFCKRMGIESATSRFTLQTRLASIFASLRRCRI
ncbi:MAG: hypothetical protein WAL97_05195 [Halobacteriota archaeon]